MNGQIELELGMKAKKLSLHDVAKKYFEKAAELGNAEAMYFLGNELGDSEQALKWYKQAADKGYKKAFIEIALLYLEVDNLEHNKREADKWFKFAISSNKLSAENGDPYAMLAIANAYDIYNSRKSLNYGGLGDKNSSANKWYKFAFATFKRLANGGNTEAMFEVSKLLHFGNGTAGNDKESIRWLKKAAEVDDVQVKIRAYKEIADILKFNETSIFADKSSSGDKAVTFYKKAAELGDFDSMRELWEHYKEQKNLTEAEKWLKKSEELQAKFLEALPQE